MKTIRQLIDLVAPYTDMDTSHYTFTTIWLPLKDGKQYHFSAKTDNDLRSELFIGLGNGLSTFKHGHLHIIHCSLPREFVTPEIEKYRDNRDPAMYKYHLPERIFNSIINEHPIDEELMVEQAINHYLQTAWEWDRRDRYDAIAKQYL